MMKGNNTRPTTDKVKENVFNIMGQFFEGGHVLDLFAGSGSLGIEALSRGMDHGIFIDRDFSAIQIIKENIADLKLGERTEVYRNDAFKALHVLGKKGATFDLVFLDPPYGKQSMTKLLEGLIKYELLNEEGVVMCEYGVGMDVVYDPSLLKEVRKEVYGTIEILILKRRGR